MFMIKKTVNNLKKTFSALRFRNFRLFWTGQSLSLIGTWMQNIGQAWLVLKLTNSSFLLGLSVTVQYLPLLFLSVFAGSIVDRFRKRQVVIITQSSMAVLALIMGILTVTGVIQYWHVLVLAMFMGLATTFDVPARQSFMIYLVGRDDLMNAISLNSAIFNMARLIGPAIAGLLIAKVGIAPTFFLNSASFLAVIGGLLLIDVDGSPGASVAKNIFESMKEGLRYIRNNEVVFNVISLLAILSLFSINFSVLIPLFAKLVLHQNAAGFGFLMSSMGLGALTGAIFVAFISRYGPKNSIIAAGALIMTLFQIVLSFTQTFHAAVAALFITGLGVIMFTASSNTAVQLNTPDELRGRVMSVYALVFLGVTPVGSFLAGSIASLTGTRIAIFAGAAAGLAAALVFYKRITGKK